ncbi:MAG: ATP-binding cassette domain-containing protein [Enterococcus sp.]
MNTHMLHYLKLDCLNNVLYILYTLCFTVFFSLATISMTFVINALVKLDFFLVVHRLGINIVIITLAYTFSYIRNVQKEKCIQQAIFRMKMDILQNLEEFSYKEFYQKNYTDYSAWLSTDATIIEDKGFRQFYEVIYCICMILSSFVSLLFYNVLFIVLSLGTAVVISFISKKFQKVMDQKTMIVSKEMEESLSNTVQLLKGFDILFSLNKRHLFSRYSTDNFVKVQNAKNDQVKTLRKLFFSLQMTQVAGETSVMLLSAFLAIQKIIPIGSVVSTTTLSGNLYDTLVQATTLWSEIKSINPVFDKLFPKEPLREKQRGTQSVDTFKKDIHLSNLAYTYDKNMTIHFPEMVFVKNKKYAIIGRSGSGKSTLLNILAGLVNDYTGDFLIDEKQMSNLNLSDYRESISYISQNNYLFNLTLKDNLLLEDSYEEDDLFVALGNSSFQEDFQLLPFGLDTQIKAGGINLSGGQVQRLSIARSFLRLKDIVIIDEGTAHLDEDKAIEIERSLLTDPSKTVIMVTHQLRPETEKLLHKIYKL